MFQKLREGLTASAVSKPIQKCETLFSQSKSASVPLHLSMEAALFNGWNLSHSAENEIDAGKKNLDENAHKWSNIQTSSSSSIRPITLLHQSEFERLTLRNLQKCLQATKHVHVSLTDANSILKDSLRTILHNILSNEEYTYAFSNATTTLKATSFLSKGRNDASLSLFIRTQPKEYESVQRMYIIKSIMEELLRLGIVSNAQTHWMLTSLLGKCPYFLLDGEMLRTLIQFGTFSALRRDKCTISGDQERWSSDMIHIFSELFLCRDSKGCSGTIAPFRFALGSIVQYYVLLQPFDVHHNLLTKLFERIDGEILERNSLLAKALSMSDRKKHSIIHRLGGLSCDKLSLTSADITTLVGSLCNVSLVDADVPSACAYFLLLSQINTVLKIRSSIEHWSFSFLSETASIMSRIQAKAYSNFSKVNERLNAQAKRLLNETSITRILLSSARHDLHATQQMRKQLHVSFDEYSTNLVIDSLLKMGENRLVSFHKQSNRRSEYACADQANDIDPIALASLCATASKHAKCTLTVNILHEHLHSHSSMLYSKNFACSSKNTLHAVLRAYLFATWQAKSIDSNSVSFMKDLSQTFDDLRQSSTRHGKHHSAQETYVLPYIAAVLYRGKYRTRQVQEDLLRLSDNTDYSSAKMCPSKLEELSLLLWLLVRCYRDFDQPLGYERAIQIVSKLISSAQHGPLSELTLLVRADISEIMKASDLFCFIRHFKD